MDIINALLISTLLVNILLGVFLVKANRGSKINISYGLVTLAIIGWTASMLLYRNSSESTATIYTVLLYVLATFTASSFLFFTLIFPSEEQLSRLKTFSIFLGNIVIVGLTLIPGYVIEGTYVEPGQENTIIFGPFYLFYAAYILIYFVAGFVNLVTKYFKSSGIERVQLRYIFLGYFVAANLAFITNLVLPWMGIFIFNWAGQVLTVIMVGFTTYAILKHHLLHLKVISTEIFSILIVITLFIETIVAKSLNEMILRAAIFIGVALFSVLLTRSVAKEVENTERVEQLSKDLEHANSSLAKLLKMKSEFLNLVSHQLRTPLTAVVGFLEWWKTGEINQMSPEKQKKMMSNVIMSADRLHNTVEDILTVLKVQSETQYKFEPMDIYILVKEALEVVKPIYDSKNLYLKMEASPKNMPEVIVGDRRFLKQVFINLIDNAAKYTEAGGTTISFKIYPDPEDDYNRFVSGLGSNDKPAPPYMPTPSAPIGEIEASSPEKNTTSINQPDKPKQERWVYISFKDTGIGLAEDDKQKLFKQFSRGVEANKLNTTGSGLGLFLVKEIVDAHQGKVEVNSEGKGKGSTFTVGLRA